MRALAPEGIHHIVEVAFGANISTDMEMLAVRGLVATYATDVATPAIPFWPLLFKNVRIDFLGSDDFTHEDKSAAASAINEALVAGWAGFEIAERFPRRDCHRLRAHGGAKASWAHCRSAVNGLAS